MRWYIGCTLLCVLSFSTLAGELLESYVEDKGEHYLLHLDMRINGQYDDVYAVLVDFDNITAINDSIVFSKRLETQGKKHLVQFDSEGCVWFFCRRVVQLVHVTELDQGYIMSTTDPEKSDLSYGRTLWQVIDEGETTRIKYNADYVPDFWIPPLIGPVIFKNRLLEEGQKTINGIERLVSNDYTD